MFHERLRLLRENIGMTQIEFAKKINVSPTTYRNYENTSREPNYETLIKIASELGVTIDYLLGIEYSKVSTHHLYASIENLSDDSLAQLIDFLDYLKLKDYLKRNKKSDN